MIIHCNAADNGNNKKIQHRDMIYSFAELIPNIFHTNFN